MNGNVERRGALLWSGRTSTSCLRSPTDPFAFFTGLPATFRPEISMKHYLNLRKLRTSNTYFLEIILSPCKIKLLM